MESSQLDSLTNSVIRQSSPVVVSDAVLIRLGGLPFSCTESLKAPGGGASIERSQWLEAARMAKAQDLSALLHGAVGEVKGDPPLQRALLAIRRNTFNGRRPSAADLTLAMPALTAGTRAALEDWLQIDEQLSLHNQASEDALSASVARGRRQLKRLMNIPEFRKGLLLSSKSFLRGCEEYVANNGEKLDRKRRRTERTLLSYLLRTTHKASPFSTFTAVSFARFSDDDASSGLPVFDSYRIESAVKPNCGILSRVAQALTARASQIPQLRLTISPGASVQGDRLMYWKRTESPMPSDGPVHTRVSEHSFWVHMTLSLNLILQSIEAAGDMTVAEIQKLLQDGVGVSPADAAEYVRLLVENRLLVVSGVRQSVFDPNGWLRFCEELLKNDDPAIQSVAYSLQAIRQDVNAFANADISARPAMLESLEGQVQSMLQLLGSDAPPLAPVLFEDARIGRQPVPLNKAAWQDAFADLADLQKALSLFDPLLIPKASLKAIFKRKFRTTHRCTDLLAFSDYYAESFYRPYQQATIDAGKKKDINFTFGQGTLNPLRLPEISQILDARADLTGKLADGLAKSSRSDEFQIPEDWLRPVGDRLLARHRLLSNSFFVQPVVQEAGLFFVLNHVYGGFGCMYTRFQHLFEGEGHSLEDALRSTIDRLEIPDAVYAEFQGGHDTNLNQHNLLTGAEIVCPGERGLAATGRRIHISDLEIRYDPQLDEVFLFCERLGKKVIPLFLGLLYPLVLPELQTLLLLFSPPTVLRNEIVPRQVPEANTVGYQPRVRYKSVVVERAKWTLRLASFPQRESNERDYAYLLRVAKWRLESGIPRQVFAKLAPPEFHPDDGQAPTVYYGTTQQKPFYVDFENAFCLSLLEKLASDHQGYLFLTEMLPASQEAAVRHAGETYVSEFVLEITQKC